MRAITGLLLLLSSAPSWASLTVVSGTQCGDWIGELDPSNDCGMQYSGPRSDPYSYAHTNGDAVTFTVLRPFVDSLFLFGYARAEAYGLSIYDSGYGFPEYVGTASRAATTITYTGTSAGAARPGKAQLVLIDHGSFDSPPNGRLGVGMIDFFASLNGHSPGWSDIMLGESFTATLFVSAQASSGLDFGMAQSWYEAQVHLFEADGVTPVSVLPLREISSDPIATPEPGNSLLSAAALTIALAALKRR